jgi:hypothetical protein
MPTRLDNPCPSGVDFQSDLPDTHQGSRTQAVTEAHTSADLRGGRIRKRRPPGPFVLAPSRKPGRPRKLLTWQISYVRRALQLHYRLSPSHLARRFGVTRDTIHNYSNAKHKDWPTGRRPTHD